MSWNDFTQKLVTLGVAGFLLKVVGALVVWIIGRRLIQFAIAVAVRTLRRQAVEETLLVYIASTISVLLNVALVIAVLGYFGVETTTFAALVAGVGVAIGAAWGGLLATSRPARSWWCCAPSRWAT
jgi:small conductance mechanosensitive channel